MRRGPPVGVTASDRGVRAVVITGTGTDAFCSGMDLKGAHARDAGTSTDPGPVAAVSTVSPVEALRSLPMPTIAAINGTAVAGGLEVALARDIRDGTAAFVETRQPNRENA